MKSENWRLGRRGRGRRRGRFGAAACASTKADPTAQATIESKSGSKVAGKAIFTELPSGQTRVEVTISERHAGNARPAHPREGRLLGAGRDFGRRPLQRRGQSPCRADRCQAPQRRPRQHRDRRRRQGLADDHDRHADRHRRPQLRRRKVGHLPREGRRHDDAADGRRRGALWLRRRGLHPDGNANAQKVYK